MKTYTLTIRERGKKNPHTREIEFSTLLKDDLTKIKTVVLEDYFSNMIKGYNLVGIKQKIEVSQLKNKIKEMIANEG